LSVTSSPSRRLTVLSTATTARYAKVIQSKEREASGHLANVAAKAKAKALKDEAAKVQHGNVVALRR
jgi:hypothetical protein